MRLIATVMALSVALLVPVGRASAETASPVPTFRDCPDCPEMAKLPAGSFQMGSLHGDSDEVPIHTVTIAKPFAIGRYPVTFAEWDACVAEGGCKEKPDDGGWGHGNQPVVNVSWNDAQEFVKWLSKKAGHKYSLTSEAEYEYAARAGSATEYPWGETIGDHHVTCDKACTPQGYTQPLPVGTSFQPNAWGLYDMLNDVRAWMEDCYHETYAGAPADEKPWVKNCAQGQHKGKAIRGSSWYHPPGLSRSANRSTYDPDTRAPNTSFRVARALE